MGDAAGLIIGLPGLVTSCADLFKLTVAARNVNDDVKIVLTMVVVEQTKFAIWLEEAGFVEGSKPVLKIPTALQNMLKAMLEGVMLILKGLGKTINKYELPSNERGSTQVPKLPDELWRLRLESDPSTQSSLRKTKKLINSTAGAIKWAAAEQERADRDLNRLRILIEDLFMFVSDKLGKANASLLPSRILQHIEGKENLEHFIKATAQHYPDLAQCAEFKQQAQAATGLARPASQKSPLQLLGKDFLRRRSTQHSKMAVAVLGNSSGGSETVLLEDKAYADGSPDYEKFVETRVEEVSFILSKTPKSPQMRILDCVGYIKNIRNKSFSFVFRTPPGFDSGVEPVSLQNLLPPGSNGWFSRRRTGHGGSDLEPMVEKPSLRTRFQMASSLCRTVSLLQACGVLHKGLAPENVLFFTKPKTSSTFDLSDPFLTGFAWARLHGSQYISDHAPIKDFAQGSGLLHAHPAYSFRADQRYLKVFDLYSLGLLLLQIGSWRRLADIADELFPSTRSVTNKTGYKLDEAKAGGVIHDEWLLDSVETWQEQLFERQGNASQSGGVYSMTNPRSAFRERLVKNLDRLLVADVGETYTRVVAQHSTV